LESLGDKKTGAALKSLLSVSSGQRFEMGGENQTPHIPLIGLSTLDRSAFKNESNSFSCTYFTLPQVAVQVNFFSLFFQVFY